MLKLLNTLIKRFLGNFSKIKSAYQQVDAMAGIGPIMSVVNHLKQQYIAEQKQSYAEQMSQLNAHQFRQLIAKALSKQGYCVVPVKNNATDLLAQINNCGVLIRTKNNAHSLIDFSLPASNLEDCQFLSQDCQLIEAEAGILVSTGTICREAYQYCRNHNIYGLSDYNLMRLLTAEKLITINSPKPTQTYNTEHSWENAY